MQVHYLCFHDVNQSINEPSTFQTRKKSLIKIFPMKYLQALTAQGNHVSSTTNCAGVARKITFVFTLLSYSLGLPW